MIDPTILIPSGVNAILLGVTLWLMKHWMKELCDRVTRLENIFLLRKGE